MSVLFADPSELHAIAHRIRSHADALRNRAMALAARAENARWHSPAAGLFRERARHVACAMRAAAGRLDDAADALDRHANRLHNLLADAERFAAGVVSEGAELVDDVGSMFGSALDLVGL